MKSKSAMCAVAFAACFMSRLAAALGGGAGDYTIIAATNSGFESIGSAVINSAGDRVVFKAATADDGDRLFVWTPSAGAAPIAAVDAQLADLKANNPGAVITIGELTAQRSGDLIAYTTRVDQQTPQVWTLDLDGPNVPVEVSIGAPGALLTAVANLSIDESGGLSFWKLTCGVRGCTHRILDSTDVGNPIAQIAGPDAALLPARAPDGSRTLFLEHIGGTFALRSSDQPDPVYTAANEEATQSAGVLSAASLNPVNAALFIGDLPSGALPIPGIYVYGHSSAGITGGDLAVRFDGGDVDGFALAPALDVRPSINIDNDLAFVAIDVSDAIHLNRIFLRGDELQPLITQGENLFVDGQFLSEMNVHGLSDRDDGTVQVLFRSAMQDIGSEGGQDAWAALIVLAALASDPEPTCPADLDNSGFVGVDDLLMLLGAWGFCPGCPADLTGDDTVGVADLLALLAAWGPCP